MPTASISFHLDQPPERVFDYIADIRNEREWSKDMKRAELATDGPLGDGSVFETDYRGFGAMRIELQEYRRPEHLVFAGDGPRMRMRFVMDVAPQDGGSRVTFGIDMQPRGPMKVMTPLLKLGMPRELAKRPQQFRDALAGG
jgi:uncharacterized protein YndB with AHSA1/START domain